MVVNERRNVILETLDRRGACSYQELRDLLKVSIMTVRRDVDRLAGLGQVIKTLGGAQRANAPAYWYESNLPDRLARQMPEKRAIAAAALAMVGHGQSVYMDGSTTCLELAKLIAEKRSDVVVVTNSVLVCVELARNGASTVIGLGGECDPSGPCFVGPACEEMAQRYFVDLAFVSTKGLLPADGTFESSVGTFRVKQIMARQCARLVLLVDHTKFGQRSLSKVLDISQIHAVITDAQAPEADLAALREMGKDVQVVST